MAKTETETAVASEAPLSNTQLVDIFKALIDSQQRTADQIATQTGDAIANATMKTRQWWNEAEYPERSVLNPLGEKDHPRPKFVREFFMLNYHCDENQHTAEEIACFNRLKPGEYPLRNPNGDIERHKFFVVREREPGIPNGPLMIEFPCKDTNDRMTLARLDRGRGAVDLLEQMIPETWKTPVGV